MTKQPNIEDRQTLCTVNWGAPEDRWMIRKADWDRLGTLIEKMHEKPAFFAGLGWTALGVMVSTGLARLSLEAVPSPPAWLGPTYIVVCLAGAVMIAVAIIASVLVKRAQVDYRGLLLAEWKRITAQFGNGEGKKPPDTTPEHALDVAAPSSGSIEMDFLRRLGQPRD